EQQIEQANRLAEQRIEQARQLSEHLSMVARTLIQTHDDERAAIARKLHDHIDRLAVVSTLLHRIRQNPPGSVAEGSQEIVGAEWDRSCSTNSQACSEIENPFFDPRHRYGDCKSRLEHGGEGLRHQVGCGKRNL